MFGNEMFWNGWKSSMCEFDRLTVKNHTKSTTTITTMFIVGITFFL